MGATAGLTLTPALAQRIGPKEGEDFIRLPKPAPVESPAGQIEVLEKELNGLLGTAAPSAVRRGLNEVRTNVELAFLKAQGESVALEQRRRELGGQVSDVQAQVGNLQLKHAAFESLLRQKSLTEQAYLSSTKSLQERASIEEIESKRVANVRVLTPPEPAREPTRSRLAIAAGGVLLGLLSAVVAAVLGHRFRRSFIDPERLETDLGLPVLACIDERRPAGASGRPQAGARAAWRSIADGDPHRHATAGAA